MAFLFPTKPFNRAHLEGDLSRQRETQFNVLLKRLDQLLQDDCPIVESEELASLVHVAWMNLKTWKNEATYGDLDLVSYNVVDVSISRLTYAIDSVESVIGEGNPLEADVKSGKAAGQYSGESRALIKKIHDEALEISRLPSNYAQFVNPEPVSASEVKAAAAEFYASRSQELKTATSSRLESKLPSRVAYPISTTTPATMSDSGVEKPVQPPLRDFTFAIGEHVNVLDHRVSLWERQSSPNMRLIQAARISPVTGETEYQLADIGGTLAEPEDWIPETRLRIPGGGKRSRTMRERILRIFQLEDSAGERDEPNE